MAFANPNNLSPIGVSVIVPAYNASATMARCLQALSQQNCFQPFEIIVVDDGSFDDTAKIVCSFPGVQYVRQENAGPASARNHGAKLARGEFLAFTDSDCIPHDDWITRLMAGLGQSQVAVVAGSYGIANGESRLARCVFAEIRWRHTHIMPDFPKAFGSYNFCVKKNVFLAVGGFHEGYRHASGEDNDLSYKIIGLHERIYFERKALVDHYHPSVITKYLKEQFRHGCWRVKMYQDHPAMVAGDGYTFWKDALELLWSLAGCLGLLASACHLLHWRQVLLGILCPFLFFEILWGFIMMRCFFDGIFLGIILFFRAFARMLGFSTGIFVFMFFKNDKIFE